MRNPTTFRFLTDRQTDGQQREPIRVPFLPFEVRDYRTLKSNKEITNFHFSFELYGVGGIVNSNSNILGTINLMFAAYSIIFFFGFSYRRASVRTGIMNLIKYYYKVTRHFSRRRRRRRLKLIQLASSILFNKAVLFDKIK